MRVLVFFCGVKLLTLLFCLVAEGHALMSRVSWRQKQDTDDDVFGARQVFTW